MTTVTIEGSSNDTNLVFNSANSTISDGTKVSSSVVTTLLESKLQAVYTLATGAGISPAPAVAKITEELQTAISGGLTLLSEDTTFMLNNSTTSSGSLAKGSVLVPEPAAFLDKDNSNNVGYTATVYKSQAIIDGSMTDFGGAYEHMNVFHEELIGGSINDGGTLYLWAERQPSTNFMDKPFTSIPELHMTKPFSTSPSVHIGNTDNKSLTLMLCKIKKRQDSDVIIYSCMSCFYGIKRVETDNAVFDAAAFKQKLFRFLGFEAYEGTGVNSNPLYLGTNGLALSNSYDGRNLKVAGEHKINVGKNSMVNVRKQLDKTYTWSDVHCGELPKL